MRIFVAGATGAMGVPLVKRLVAAGHQVTDGIDPPGKVSEDSSRGLEPAP